MYSTYDICRRTAQGKKKVGLPRAGPFLRGAADLLFVRLAWEQGEGMPLNGSIWEDLRCGSFLPCFIGVAGGLLCLYPTPHRHFVDGLHTLCSVTCSILG